MRPVTVEMEWRETRNGNLVSEHPETGERVTVFRRKDELWGGVWGGVYLRAFSDSAEEACTQMERWFAGEEVPTWKPPPVPVPEVL